MASKTHKIDFILGDGTIDTMEVDANKVRQVIRPYLDEPFQFEVEIYKKLPSDKPDISKINKFNKLHSELIKIWEILNETKTYPNLIKPLVI